MNYKTEYKVQDAVFASPLENCALEGEIGARFDRFIYERVSGRFAIEEILRESEDFFKTQYDDIYPFGYWRSEFWGKLVLSAVRCARYKNEDRLKEDLRRSCYKVLSMQREDGYLSTYRNSNNIYPVDTEKATLYMGWGADYCWNIWGIKYTLWALIESADLLDDAFILSGAIKLADWVLAKFKEDGTRVKDSGVMNGLPSSSILKPLLVLYRLTGDEKYLDFSKKIVKEWERDDNERPNLINNALSGKSVAEWYDLNDGWYPKAYEMTSCFDGILELYRLTGEKKLLDATISFYNILKKHESNILGSVGYCERYQNATLYADSATEICDVTHWMRLCFELYRITGEVEYMDSFEKAFVNAFLAGVYADGRGGAFFVRGAGRHWTALPHCETKYQHCCVNNIGRGFANAAESCVMQNDKGYYVNMYTQSYVTFGDTEIRVGAGYFDIGWVGISVRNPEKGKKLYLRIPEWSKNTYIRIGLEKSEVYAECGKYFEIDLTEETTFLKVRFDMEIECIKREWFPIPEGDYHLVRYTDVHKDLCDRSCMLSTSKIVLRRGAVILARTKKLCAKEEDMFNSESLYDKNIENINASLCTNNKGNLATVRVGITADKKVYEYVMCDYASSANIDTCDPKYFSIYL